MFRVWIALPADDTRYPGGQKRIDARSRRPVMRARLESDIDRRAACARPRRLQCDDLGMRAPLALVPPLGDDLAVGHDHRPDDGVRIGLPAAVLGELERAFEEPGVHGADPTGPPYAHRVRLPPVLVDTWSREPAWLDALPRLVSECAERWSLELEDPIDTPHSLVVPAGELVLKLNAPSHTEADTEADALQHWGGRGAVLLHARDRARGALLVERCAPGTELWNSDADATDVIAGLLPRLQVPVSAAHPFTHLATEADRWAEDVPRWFTAAAGPFERTLLDAALDVYRTVDRSASYLVNQDLHGGNVLSASREPWLVIDPKPLVGERELEASGLLRNADSVSRWLDALADLGLDRERARGWGVAHNLAWAWDERGGWSLEQVAIADRILKAP